MKIRFAYQDSSCGPHTWYVYGLNSRLIGKVEREYPAKFDSMYIIFKYDPVIENFIEVGKSGSLLESESLF